VIAFSAILVRLADVSPATAALFRCLYALPVLWWLAARERRRHGPRDPHERRLAWLAGVCFAADLIFWHYSIEDVGAGLATVLGNLQVFFVAALAWALLGERPDRRSAVAMPVAFGGVVLISGVVGAGAYGDDPVRGVVFGVLTSLAYAFFMLLLRRSGADTRRVAGPLFEATAVAVVGSAIGGIAIGDIDPVPGLESQAWLVTLALSSQVLGWLLISVSLPRLPALLTSITLLIQPLGSVLLGVILLSEEPSELQLAGVAVLLSGILLATAPINSRRDGAADTVDVGVAANAPDGDPGDEPGRQRARRRDHADL
jgi:drug/metabolite transporter (DMT)-like permease